MLTYPTPRRARYTPVKGKLAYPVVVYGTRSLFGRVEYQIASALYPPGPTYTPCTVWATAGQNGQQLQFEEGEP